jgi:hypothetical protein
MARIAKEHTERLEDLKSSVEESYEYFRKNNERYNEFTKFVFYESMNEIDKQVLDDLGKPTIEFNILESFISRLRGEFSKQQPSLTVRAADGVPVNMLTPEFTKLIEVIEAHLRAIFFDAANDKLEYNVYSDLLAGGFSVMEVYTDYVNEKSFEQNIYVDRVFDPTLTGFDPMARESHKGDGRYCFQIYPRTRDQFEAEYGKEAAERMKYSKEVSGFGWSYRGEKDEIILVCDYYEKQYKKTKIYRLTNGVTVTKKEYDNALEVWNQEGRLEQFPEILDERTTDIEEIVRYRFCENELLDFTRTNYKHLPLVFVDGNSVMISNGQLQQQVTRPYVYHAKGIQRLKNFAGQTLANELENLVQHKFIVPIESIPEDYLEAYQNVQKADTLVYNHFLDKNSPEITLPPPREIQRTPIPPEVTNTFRLSDEMTQTILGSYDSALGINSNQISGRAIQAGAMQSNAAAMPYIVGYIKGLNRVAQIIVDLIPKFYRTPRSLPVLKQNGARSYEIINKMGSLYMNYDPNSLQVKVETGVNFSMQKEVALRTVTEMMQASPVFGEFINTKGLSFLLDNIEIRGIEQLKMKAEEFERENDQKIQQQQMMQMQQLQQQTELQMASGRANVTRTQAEAMKSQAEAQKEMKEAQGPSKSEIELMKVQLDAQKNAADEAIKKQDADTKFFDVVSKVRNDEIDSQLEMSRLDAEQARTQVELFGSLAKLKEDVE